MTFLKKGFHYPKRVIPGRMNEVVGSWVGESGISSQLVCGWAGRGRSSPLEGSVLELADLANQFGMTAWMKLSGWMICGTWMAWAFQTYGNPQWGREGLKTSVRHPPLAPDLWKPVDFLTLDDEDDPGGLCALMNEVACGVRVLPIATAPIWAHLGTPGRDFPPQPLFRYSFLMIERQIGIFAGVKDKKRGRRGRPIKSINAPDSEIPLAHPASQIKA